MDKKIEKSVHALKNNLEKVIRGKAETIELALTTLFGRGHLLIEDVPGVGKTTLAHALARSIDGSFQRIQFTSDLMPSDVLGVTIYNERERAFEFKRGPVFSNIVLADEINRATPKTQSALLEAMSERQVSVENATHKLPSPFMLLATQNPLEYAGTFPLPESQLDRFMLSISMGYPSPEVELEILRSPSSSLTPDTLSPVISCAETEEIQKTVETVTMEDSLAQYIVAIVNATRTHADIKLGVSTRGAMAFYRASQSLALVRGRDYCLPDDVKDVAAAVLSHRIITSGIEGAESSANARRTVTEILSKTAVPV